MATFANPYPVVRLAKKGWKSNALSVHRMVAESFIGPIPDGMVVRHLDGEPTNNRVTNLAIGSHSENHLDKRRHGTDPNAAKSYCVAGHPYSDENTYRRPDRPGSRQCRACNRQAARRYASRQKQVGP